MENNYRTPQDDNQPVGFAYLILFVFYGFFFLFLFAHVIIANIRIIF